MKIFILSKDLTFARNVESILDKTRHQISKPTVEANSLYSYISSFKPDACIIHKSYLNGSYNLFEQIVSSNRCLVIYFTPTMESGPFYNVMNNPLFFMLKDSSYYGINEVIDIMAKDRSIIFNLLDNLDLLKSKAEEERFIKKAKLKLMKINNISEEEAYKAILKCAMDDRISKLEACKKLLRGEK
jgi:hypothetical protein